MSYINPTETLRALFAISTPVAVEAFLNASCYKRLSSGDITIYEDDKGVLSGAVSGQWTVMDRRWVGYNEEPVSGAMAVYTIHRENGDIVAYIDGNDDFYTMSGERMARVYGSTIRA